MNDAFEKKLGSAAVAGWWSLLIAVVFITVQWIAYLAIMHSRPAWVLEMWGLGICDASDPIEFNRKWLFVQTVWLWIVGVFKLCVWLLALVVAWLTLWARQLRKRAETRESPLKTALESD